MVLFHALRDAVFGGIADGIEVDSRIADNTFHVPLSHLAAADDNEIQILLVHIFRSFPLCFLKNNGILYGFSIMGTQMECKAYKAGFVKNGYNIYDSNISEPREYGM